MAADKAAEPLATLRAGARWIEPRHFFKEFSMFWVAFVYGAGGSLGAATGILMMLAGMAVLDTITGKAERQLKDLEQSKATSVEMLAALLARNEIGRQQVAALEKLCERGPCVFHNDDE